MELGKQIYELRKKANLSQEQLAEKIGVSRQTISKWELGETAPDIKQAQLLSQIFNVSLDELTGNDTKEVIYKKVSNTERLAGIVIKILKVLGVLILCSVVAIIISIIVITNVRQETSFDDTIERVFITESVGDEKYFIEIGADGSFDGIGLSEEIESDVKELIDFEDLDSSADRIKDYFIELREELNQETP